ncbi:hypothetical protein BH23GEM1_BH23GEM1_08090 [soil metagenome]
MTELINSLPALSSVNPAYPGVIVFLLVIVTVIFRWRKNAGFVSGPEALMAVGVAASGASGATSAGGRWPNVVLDIGLAAVVFGAVALKLQDRRNRNRKEDRKAVRSGSS